MRTVRTLICLLALTLAGSSAALAWHIEGHVRCDGNKNGILDNFDLGIGGVGVHIENVGGTFIADTTTDSTGFYYFKLLDNPDSYVVTLTSGLPADAAYVIPAGGVFDFTTDNTTFEIVFDFLISSATCQPGQCWLTGGGTKWDNVTNSFLAEKGTKVSFGGNIHPGCSSTAGSGGDWNHVDRALKLHFHGTDIPTVNCGNIPGIPPGSNSPKTPFNFLEAWGTGWVKGIQGGKANFPFVYFYAKYEDRNEPGSNGAKDGSLIDKIFLRVYTNPGDPIGSTLILLDDNNGGAEIDTTTITTGNLQIHISSCDNPPLP